MLANSFGSRQINRAGVRLLFGDAGFGQIVNDRFGFDFQFPSQLVNPNLSFVSHSWALRFLLCAFGTLGG
jgi:hypothetical protein